MTADEQTILMFRGLIASLPEESQAKVKQAEKQIRDLLPSYPEGEAFVAMECGNASRLCGW